MLYAHTVFATVYRAREKGVVLPMPMRGVSGHLEMARGRDCQPAVLRATLRDARKSNGAALLPDLHSALVRRISVNGIRIDGFEVIARRRNAKSAADHYAQTWFCLVHTMNLAELLDMGNLQELLGDPNSATGF